MTAPPPPQPDRSPPPPQGAPRDDGPTWPGPPSTWPGGPGGARPGGSGPPGHGPGGPGPGGPDGPPPPPWQRRRRRVWLVLAAVAGALLLGFLLVRGMMALGDVAGGIQLTEGPRGDAPPADEGGEDGAVGPREEIEPLDLDGLDGTDAELGAILTDIDRAEVSMIETQDRFAAVLAEAATTPDDPDPEGLLEELSDLAGEGQRELQGIRSDLAGADASTSVVRDVRDVYLTHLDAWVRYFVAVEDDPRLLVSGEDQAFTLAINTSADAFARHVRQELPDDVDERVRDYADAILERGFPGRAPSDDDTV